MKEMKKEQFLKLSPAAQSVIIAEDGVIRQEKKRGSSRIVTYRIYDFEIDIEFRK